MAQKNDGFNSKSKRVKSNSFSIKMLDGRKLDSSVSYYEPQDKHHGFDFKVGNVRYKARGKDMDPDDRDFISRQRFWERSSEDNARFYKQVRKKAEQSHRHAMEISRHDLLQRKPDYELAGLSNGTLFYKNGKLQSDKKRVQELYDRSVYEQKQEAAINKEVDRIWNKISDRLIWDDGRRGKNIRDNIERKVRKRISKNNKL